METMKYIRLAALLLTLPLAGCADFDEGPQPDNGDETFEGRLIKTRVSLSVAPELDEQGRVIPITRAPIDITDAEERDIRNVWVFQFGKQETPGDDDSRLFIRSFYIDEDEIDAAKLASTGVEINLVESGSDEHMLVFIANMNEADYGWNLHFLRNTYADLKARNYPLRGDVIEDSRLWGDDYRNIIMSGMTKTTIAEGALIPGTVLTPSLAKLTFDLSLGQDVDYKVLSVRIYNIPNRIWYTDALNGPKYPYPAGSALMNYPLESDFEEGILNSSKPQKTWVWYIPPYLLNSTQNTGTPADKNKYAPYNATRIEVIAKNATTNEGVRYTFYPGANSTDFNLRANHRYFVKQIIKGDGGDDPTDSRIEQFRDSVMLDGHTNSFILNPPITTGMAPRTYWIPITRVNEYWEPNQQSFPGYGGLQEGAIRYNSRWQVDLLWQDINTIVRDKNDPSKTANHVWLEQTTGVGPDGHFAITVPPGAVHGNFVIVIRIYDPQYAHLDPQWQVLTDQVLWSWHFWVTDYNPDRMKQLYTPDGSKFFYPVPGGQVERYGGAIWGYDTPGATINNNWNNYEYNPSSTEAYAKSFMMDRSLGSITPMPANNSYSAQGRLTYQFGRKDPFPPSTIYNIAGNSIGSSTTGFQAQRTITTFGSTNRISYSVNYPTTFIYNSSTTQGRWTTDVDGYSATAANSYIWQDVRVPAGVASANVRGYKGKSIFDPCPKGWKVPVHHAFEDFSNSTSYGYRTGYGRVGNNAVGYRDFPSTSYTMFYWPNVEINGEHPVEGRIVFPTYNGLRTYTGSVSSSSTGYLRSAVPASQYYYAFYSSYTTSSFIMSDTYAYSPYPRNRSVGMPVRCVSYDEEEEESQP